MKEIEISEEEFFEKRLEVAQNLLPQMVAKVSEEFMQDKRNRASLIDNCVSISHDLMTEAGFVIEPPPKLLGGGKPASSNINDRRKQNTSAVQTKNKEINLDEARKKPLTESTMTDITERTAIRKLSEMIPSKE